ncbi:Catenin-beta-like protein [Obelidium mucronatum]|nr:Catenin-beta-like protein [Obelidium mucronatum]
MDLDRLFKAPTGALGKAKRKMAAEPSDAALKRLRAGADGDDDADAEQRNTDDADARFLGGDGLSAEQRALFALVDAAEDAPVAIDVATLKRLVLRLERAITRNEELRVRHADDPLKFIDSEADLDEDLHSLMAVSAAPELYASLVSLGTVASLLALLEHPNTDIAIATIRLLSELTDDDVVQEASEEGDAGMKIFVKSLLEHQILEVLVQSLTRLDESKEGTDDKQGVFNILSVIENLISVDPTIAEKVVSSTTLLVWLLSRISTKQFDSNRQYASELLAILLQNSKPNRLALASSGGVTTLLKVLSAYRKKDPKEAEEIEMMENCFDTLCLALTEPEVKAIFAEEEGVELMIITLRERKMARMRALKVLSHAMTGEGGAECCHRFVDGLGLKTLFPIFMHKGLKSYKKEYKTHSETEEDEHVLSILASLFKTAQPETLIRICLKFSENDFEKVERLLELHEQYQAKVVAADQQFERDRAEEEREEGDEELDQEDERYLNRLDKGLFTLQLVDLVAGFLCTQASEDQVRDRMKFLIGRKGKDFTLFTNVLEEYAMNTGDPNAETNPERDIIVNLIEKLHLVNASV